MNAATPAGPFAGIVGQPRAVLPLRRALEDDRLFPSLIFHGPPGIGKLCTAFELARTLLCTAAPDRRPCRHCSSCRRTDEHALVHPDLRIVFPEKLTEFKKEGGAAESETSGIDPQELQAEAIANPSWSILIDRVRQAITALHRRPTEGACSVLIIDQAHRLAPESANALLKTLEEPPPHAVILLLSASLHALLPTIRSRCQAMPFQPVPRGSVAAHLRSLLDLSPEEAALRAGLSDGRIGSAVDLDLAAYRERREKMLQLLDLMAGRCDAGIAVTRAEEMARGGEGPEADLEILMTLLRDLLILRASPADASRLIHVDIGPRLETLAGHSPAGDRLTDPATLEALESTLGGLRRRGNRQLLLENFLLGLLPQPARPGRPA